MEKEETKAVRLFRKAAEQGHPEAQYQIGECYYEGFNDWGVEVDESEAVKWYRKAAEQGCYAARLYLTAVEHGDLDAQNVQSETPKDGEGVDKYYAEAVRWYRKAAEQGDAEAQWHLGASYLWGNGVKQDKTEAIKWYRKAADQGNRLAIEELEYL